MITYSQQKVKHEWWYVLNTQYVCSKIFPPSNFWKLRCERYLRYDLTGFQLPLAVYESVLVEADWTLTQWHPVTWSFASEQVERISIENVAQISVPSSNSGALTNKQIAGQLSAISMLQDRLELLYDFLMVRY